MEEKDLLANAIVKGFAYEENGGKVDIDNPRAGSSGELKSIFQFLPATWEKDSKQVFGKEVPINPDNETYVMKQKVLKWIDEGKSVSEMASIHNSGNPNAYKENHVGVNKYGVKYDTPTYAKNVVNYAKDFYDKNQKPPNQQNVPPDPNIQKTAPVQQLPNTGLLGQTISQSKLKV